MKKIAVLITCVFSFFIAAMPVYSVDMQGISAKAAVVMDSATGDILFGKNENEKLPMASTTKIMSALIVLESENLDEAFTVDSEAIKIEGSSMGLREGDIVTLRDLCYGMLLPSGNDAASAAAVRIAGSVDKFVEMMNDKAEELGLSSTHFVTPSGLDDYTDEHYSTAADMAKLTAEALKNQEFRKICGCKNAKLKFGNPPFERWLTNTNKLLKMLDGCVGVKTGFTDKAKRCLISACQRNGAELICVTLNAPDDWNDHISLYNTCFNYYEKQSLYIDDKKLYVNAVGGDSDKIKCCTGTAYATLLRGKSSEVTVRLILPKFVYAPVKSGEAVGCAEYFYKGVKIAEEKIYTAEECEYQHFEESGFFNNLFKRLNQLLG